MKDTVTDKGITRWKTVFFKYLFQWRENRGLAQSSYFWPT
jgi:hypothetical protein